MPILETFGGLSIRGLISRGPKASLVVFSDSSPTATTGGWYGVFNAGTTNPIITQNSTNLYVQSPWWCDGDARTNNNFDLTGVKSMTLIVSSSVGSPSYYYSSFSYTNTSGGWSGVGIGSPSDYNFSRRTITQNITDGGNGKLKLNVVNSEGGGVTLHSVIFNY